MTPNKNEFNNHIAEIDKRAFVAYYNENSIMPVSQDVNDPDFMFRRESLYRMLGIPLPTLCGKQILELGPGGGFNAIAVTHYKPRSYVFVDAAKISLQELKRKKATGLFGDVEIDIIQSNIFDYADKRVFDLVIIEGVIPGQTKPDEILKHAASFVAPNSFLVTTTTTAAGLMSEVCRRLFRPFILDQGKTFDEQIAISEKIFDPHLKSLETRTRPTRDWVLDVILHEWENGAKVVFSLLDSCRTLGPNFEFYNSSPKFFIDDRFYKKINRPSGVPSESLSQQFSHLPLAFLDYRVSLLDILKSGCELDVEDLCTTLFNIQLDIVEANSYNKLEEFMSYLKKLKKLLPDVSSPTVVAIDEFLIKFPEIIKKKILLDLPEFSSWWGRGQQYSSFTRIR